MSEFRPQTSLFDLWQLSGSTSHSTVCAGGSVEIDDMDLHWADIPVAIFPVRGGVNKQAFNTEGAEKPRSITEQPA